MDDNIDHPRFPSDQKSYEELDDKEQGVDQSVDQTSTYREAKSPWSKLNQTWFWELGGFLLSLGCIAATMTLLRVYDHQRVPEWPVTLNVALSLLGNIAFTGTLFGVHMALAQAKWIWFVEKPRPLAELAAFQKARGGPIGAIRLIFTAGTQIFVFTGSLAIVLGMLWGPFTQNLIRYELGVITAPNGTALVSRSVEYSSRGALVESGKHYPDPFLELNIMNALVTAPANDGNTPMFLCSTGNCTWAPFATLGFCSQCTDMTPQIDLRCERDDKPSLNDYYTDSPNPQKCTATLPGDTVSLTRIGTDMWNENLMNVTRIRQKDGSRLTDGPGLQFHSLRLLPPYSLLMSSAPRPLVTLANFSATDCWLKLCVQSVNASVRAGVYSETVLDTFTEAPAGYKTWITYRLQPPWGVERGIDPAARLSFGFTEQVQLDWSPSASLPDFMPFNSIAGYAQTLTRHTGVAYCNIDGAENMGQCIEGAMPRYIFNARYNAKDCGSPNADTFACAMRDIAAAVTRTFRNSGIIANGTNISDAFLVSGNSTLASGRAETTATFVRVQWLWILLPCTVWGLGVITWIVVAFRTRRLRLPNWRDDPLPLLFLYREGDGRPSGKGAGPPGSLLPDEVLSTDDYSIWAHERVAGRIHVQLGKVPTHSGGVMRFDRTEKGF